MLEKSRLTGVKVPDEFREEFEDLATDDMTLRAKFNNFSQAIHDEQKAIMLRSKRLWAEVMSVMGLEGAWRYEDGKVYPVDEPATK